MNAHEKADRMERQAADLEAPIAVHATVADLHLQAADTLRVRQAHMRALADILRASEMPAMRPISAALPQVEQRVS